MGSEEIKAKAELAAAELRTLFAELKGARGLAGIVKAVPYVTAHVEVIGKSLAGVDKKLLAIEIAMALLPLPWWLPKNVVRALLSWLIERAVSKMNKNTQ